MSRVPAGLRWALLAVVLLLAAVIALWPRGATEPGPVDVMAEPRPAPDLAALRELAALDPCPAPVAGAAPAGPLAGVTVPCLGDEGTVDLGAALAGRPALLNLWGPLCQPCRAELPALAGYAAEPGAVPVIGIEVQRLPEGALDMLATLGVRYPSVSDPDGELRAALGSPPVLPMTYLVAADGRVQAVTPPEVLRDPARVRAVVEQYLGPS